MKINTHKPVSATYLVFSMLGLALLAVLFFSIPSAYADALQSRLFGFSFILICVLGALAGVYPSKCLGKGSEVEDYLPGKMHSKDEAEASVAFRGHHPTCTSYSSHVIHLRGESYCAGCSGLAFGALVSALGTALYLLFSIHLDEVSTPIFWLGSAGVALGLLQYHLGADTASIHFLLNVLFVLGAFLILISVLGKGSTLLGFYFLGVLLYWIATRIVLSKTGHERTCNDCEKPCSQRF